MRGINSETVDLIYLDPPFNTGRGFPFPGGGKKRKMAFTDTWKWSDEHDHHRYMLGMDCPEAVAVVDTARLINSDSHGAYIVYMGVRLLEMRRILKPDGSIYFHCDPAMSHSVKMLMDAVFGIKNFRNELIWFYPHMSAARRHFPKKHDTLFFSRAFRARITLRRSTAAAAASLRSFGFCMPVMFCKPKSKWRALCASSAKTTRTR